MNHIIEKISLLRNGKMDVLSIFIKDHRIHSMRKDFPQYKQMRMATNHLLMTPIHVLYISSEAIPSSLEEQKNFFTANIIDKGSTLFLTSVNINREYEFKSALKSLHMKLLNCPVDYAVAVKIPLRLVTTSMMRLCKKEKVAAIMIDITQGGLQTVPWGWIRESLFPFNCPLIPFIDGEKKKEKKLKQWNEQMELEKLPYLARDLKEYAPISFQDLVKLGFYPVKFGIHQGGEVSYNLYKVPPNLLLKHESELFYHHQKMHAITVHKGTIIKGPNYLKYRPGFGEHVVIKKPSFYQLNNSSNPLIIPYI